jgi:hypothetical protein
MNILALQQQGLQGVKTWTEVERKHEGQGLLSGLVRRTLDLEGW